MDKHHLGPMWFRAMMLVSIGNSPLGTQVLCAIGVLKESHSGLRISFYYFVRHCQICTYANLYRPRSFSPLSHHRIR
jgi:hypothetical protein